MKPYYVHLHFLHYAITGFSFNSFALRFDTVAGLTGNAITLHFLPKEVALSSVVYCLCYWSNTKIAYTIKPKFKADLKYSVSNLDECEFSHIGNGIPNEKRKG